MEEELTVRPLPPLSRVSLPPFLCPLSLPPSVILLSFSPLLSPPSFLPDLSMALYLPHPPSFPPSLPAATTHFGPISFLPSHPPSLPPSFLTSVGFGLGLQGWVDLQGVGLSLRGRSGYGLRAMVGFEGSGWDWVGGG